MTLIFTFIVILIIIFLGYFSKRINLLKANDVGVLNKIVIHLAMPSLVFYSLYNTDFTLISKLGILPFVNIFVSLICALIVYLLLSFLKVDKNKKWSMIIVSAMANTGFFGYPLILGVFGNNGLIRAIFYDIGTTLLFIIFNILFILRFNGQFKDLVKKILTFPLLWAVILGLLFNYLNIPLDSTILNSLNYLKSLTIPLIMLSLGLSIEFKGIRNNGNAVLFTSFIKLVIAPIIAIVLLNFLNLNNFEGQISIIEAAMPPAMLTLALAVNYDLDFHLTSDCIFFDMLISLVTLPIIMSII